MAFKRFFQIVNYFGVIRYKPVVRTVCTAPIYVEKKENVREDSEFISART